MLTVTTTKDDPRYKLDSVAVALTHTFRKEQLYDIVRHAAQIHGTEFVLRAMLDGREPEKDETKMQAIFAASQEALNKMGEIYALQVKKPHPAVGQFMVSVDGAEAPKTQHANKQLAREEAERLLKRKLKAPATVRILRIEDVLRSRVVREVVEKVEEKVVFD